MSTSSRLLAPAAALLSLALLPSAAGAASSAHTGESARSEHAVCGPQSAGSARCLAHVVDHGSKSPSPTVSSAPTGLSPTDIDTAYNFTVANTSGAGQTIAIVDAYNDPKAANDLHVFSTTLGLPDCTTTSGCFRQVNQSGGTKLPRTDSGWALEISLDIEWAHAMAPGAKILLVEASSNSFSNLMAAEDYARTHAQYVSNSWGGSEFSSESGYDSHFAQPGVSIFVSAGDNGTPAEYPSASPNVISVGGTRLSGIGTGTITETGWSSGGGGCSAYEKATAAQAAYPSYGQVNCNGKRATPDVSLDADPASGVSVYDTTSYQGQAGWFVVGGTSASSPMWAGRSAVSGTVVDSAAVYGSTISYRDITVGNNGAPCLVDFDLCTGRGSRVG
jgi:subtilase family serine protease